MRANVSHVQIFVMIAILTGLATDVKMELFLIKKQESALCVQITAQNARVTLIVMSAHQIISKIWMAHAHLVCETVLNARPKILVFFVIMELTWMHQISVNNVIMVASNVNQMKDAMNVNTDSS
jgi:hypothetical protein